MEDLHVILRHHRNSFACFAGTRRPTNSVHVVLRVGRNLKVDDHVDGGDVEAARRHISRNQNVSLVRFKTIQGVQSLLLRQLSIDVNGFEVEEAEHEGQL